MESACQRTGRNLLKSTLQNTTNRVKNINIGSNDAMMGLKKVAAPAMAGTKAKIRQSTLPVKMAMGSVQFFINRISFIHRLSLSFYVSQDVGQCNASVLYLCNSNAIFGIIGFFLCLFLYFYCHFVIRVKLFYYFCGQRVIIIL